MKKLFIALSVAAVLAFSLAPAMANVPGARDISPGSAFKSFFLVSADRFNLGYGPSTLLQISETKGAVYLDPALGAVWTKLHFHVYTMDSKVVFDFTIPITKWQTLLYDLGAMVIDMGNDPRAQLATTFEGKDYYAGYVEVITEGPCANRDNILADVIQCDLSAGIAAGSEIPVRAYVGDFSASVGCEAIAHVLFDDPDELEPSDYEVFSGAAMMAARNRVLTGVCTPDATWFALYPRYLINDDTTAKTYWLFLRSSVKGSAGLVQTIPFHTWIINGAEDWRSVAIGLREFTIIDAEELIPSGLMVTLPYIGQMNLQIEDADLLYMDLVGWNWKMAKSASGSLNWGVMSLMGADAGTDEDGPTPH